MRERGEPNTQVTVLVGIVGAVLLFVLVVLLQAFFYHAERDEVARKVVAVAPEELSALRAQQLETLHSYRWVDEKTGVVAIPIERAIELLVQESATGGEAAAGAGNAGGPGTSRRPSPG